ncbi:uncharacterized [Tachysurus ichikawai]
MGDVQRERERGRGSQGQQSSCFQPFPCSNFSLPPFFPQLGWSPSYMIRALKGGKGERGEKEKKGGDKKEERAKRICQILQCQVINHKCCEATRIQTPGPRACAWPTISASCLGGHRDFSSPRATITLVPSSEAVIQHCRDSYRQPWQTSQEFHNHIPRRLLRPLKNLQLCGGPGLPSSSRLSAYKFNVNFSNKYFMKQQSTKR